MHLHHFNVSCRGIEVAERKFKVLYGFHKYGNIPLNLLHCNETSQEYATVLKLKNIIITLTPRPNSEIDSIDDVAFTVDSVSSHCEQAILHNTQVLQLVTYISSSGTIISEDELNDVSFITKAVIKSPVGNLKHTLINKQSYSNHEFLPGFIKQSEDDALFNQTDESEIEFVDHIALAVGQNETCKFIDWYYKVLNLERFLSTDSENYLNGLVIRSKGGNGLRMLTLVEHPCVNTGYATSETEICNKQVKLVFVESLKLQGSDQIQNFLNKHGEPGVQHVAFYSNSILHDANLWLRNGVDFIKPPKAYYMEIKSTLKKLHEKEAIDLVPDIGILIDFEQPNHPGIEGGYLYQIFTKTVFNSDTFFLELIQRDNAKGFGVGNIEALWKSLEDHIQEVNDD